MTSTIAVEGKVIGQDKTIFPTWNVEISGLEKNLQLRDLISIVVQEEVDSYNLNFHQHRLSPVLSLQDIEESVKEGRVDFGANTRRPEVNFNNAVTKALNSFEEGHYFVFIDDVQIHKLEDEIVLSSSSRVVFIRLIPLVGG